MSDHLLSPLQEKLLSMLKWFDTFCRKNNLRYYVIGGTMLGAARHQGFIPWDDDLDVALPRPDYEKLRLLLKGRVIDNYILETPDSSDNSFCYPYSKLYDTSTTLIENGKVPLIRGVFIDIFSFDGIGNDYKSGIRWYRKVKTYYHFYLTRITSIRKGRSVIKNLAVIISRMIPNFIVDDVKLRNTIDIMCQKYQFDSSKWGGHFLGNWGEKEIVPREYIGTPTEYDFEDIRVFGVEQYDNYLTHVYGDWRLPPPPEKQVTHHFFRVCKKENNV